MKKFEDVEFSENFLEYADLLSSEIGLFEVLSWIYGVNTVLRTETEVMRSEKWAYNLSWVDAYRAYFPLPECLRPYTEQYLGALSQLESGDWKPTSIYKLLKSYDGYLPADWKLRLALTLPHQAKKDPSLLAYYQSFEKIGAKIETPIKIGRYLRNVMGIDDSDILAQMTVKFKIDLGLTSDLFGFVENDDMDGWGQVYRSGNIKSCMNNPSYGVMTYDTYRCYATSALGLENNGLRLAYLAGSNGRVNAVARAIVHEPSKTFVRVYGDDALGLILKSNGYERVSEYPDGLKIAAMYDADLDDAEARLCPYIDGDCQLADYDGTYWVLSENGNFKVDCTSGYVRLETATCDCCGESCNDTYTVYDRYMDETQICAHCYDNGDYVIAYYLGGEERVHYDAVIDAEGDYYVDTERNLDYYEIVYSGYASMYMFRSKCVYSEIERDYIPEDDAVYLEYYEDWACPDNVIEFEGHFIYDGHMQTWTDDAGHEHEVPEMGLSDEIDEAVEAYKATCNE